MPEKSMIIENYKEGKKERKKSADKDENIKERGQYDKNVRYNASRTKLSKDDN